MYILVKSMNYFGIEVFNILTKISLVIVAKCMIEQYEKEAMAIAALLITL